MILSHFSEQPLDFDPNYAYLQKSGIQHFKPNGLWLSDESDFGWKEWCEGEHFRLENLIFRTDFEVDLTNVLLLDTDEKIKLFRSDYIGSDPLFDFINWDKVADEYQGIVISPYSWKMRVAPGFMFYYVWDLSCLAPVEQHAVIYKAPVDPR